MHDADISGPCMDNDERKMCEMVLDLVRSVRRGKRTAPGLARAAADWEIELEGRLAPAPLRLVAEQDQGQAQAGNGEPR